MDTPTRDFQHGTIRVSDAERDRAVAELSEHYQSGRLTLEEFDDRSNSALQARTGSDLSALFTDLPAKGTLASPAAADPAFPAAPAFPVGTGGRRRGGPLAARAVIAGVIALIVLGNLAGALAGSHGQHNFGWLVPVLVLGFVFLRLSRRR
jgi:Domain of unknown function (DUF1707)